jgi:hypothetical protein
MTYPILLFAFGPLIPILPNCFGVTATGFHTEGFPHNIPSWLRYAEFSLWQTDMGLCRITTRHPRTQVARLCRR